MPALAGPPLPGAPWVRPAFAAASVKPPPAAVPDAPAFRAGPPVPGAPWLTRPPQYAAALVPVPVPPPASAPPLFTSGPPIPGAPWATRQPSGAAVPPPLGPLVPPNDTTKLKVQNLPLLAKVNYNSDGTATDDRRAERHSEVLSNFFNGLAQQGVIQQTGPSTFQLVPGAGGSPGVTSFDGRTGDVLFQNSDIQPTGVTPGTYNLCNITVTNQGLLTGATSTTSPNVRSLNVQDIFSNTLIQLTAAGVITVRAGSTGPPVTTAKVGGSVLDHTNASGTGADVTEDTLYSDSIPANLLGANGDKLVVGAGVQLQGAASTTRRVRLYFGGVAIFDTGALNLSANGSLVLWATIARLDQNNVRISVMATAASLATLAFANVQGLGVNLAAAQALTLTGQSSSGGANDVFALWESAYWWPAA